MILVFYLLALAILTVSVVCAALRNRLKTASIFGILAVYFARALPNTPPEMIWFHDPYRYYAATIAVLKTNHLTISPELFAWMPVAKRALAWPGLHLISAIVVELTGVSHDWMLRYFMPLFGPVLFLICILLLGQFVTRSWALIGAFLIAMLGLFVFFQTEYHQQGFGILFAALLVHWLVTQTKNSHAKRTWILGVVFWTALLISHIFTSLIVLIWFSVYIAGITLTNKFQMTDENVRSVAGLVAPVGIAALGWHLYVYPVVIQRSLVGLAAKLLTSITIPEPGGLGGPQHVAGTTPLDQFTIIIKVLLVGLSLPTMYLAFKDRESRYTMPVLLLISAGLTAIFLLPIRLGAVTRTILIGYLALGIMVAVSLSTVSERVKSKRPVHSGVCILLIVMVLGSVLVASPPSYVDPTSDIRADGFHKIEPPGVEDVHAGRWMGTNIPDDGSIGSVYWLRAAPVYYGRHNIAQVNTVYSPSNGNEWTYYNANRWGSAPSNVNVIYSTGEKRVVKE